MWGAWGLGTIEVLPVAPGIAAGTCGFLACIGILAELMQPLRGDDSVQNE